MPGKRGSHTEVGPPGPTHADRNGLGRQHVIDIQRARMLGAMVEQVAEQGAANTAVAHIVARSGVSRRTFYEIFKDREDCFLAAFDEAMLRIATIVVPAYEQPETWRAKIRAGLTALLESLAADPAMGRLLIVESLAAGPAAREHRQSALERIVSVVNEGRGEKSRGGTDLPALTAEGIVGGVLSVLHARLSDTANAGSLTDLTGPLMGMIVLPYLGPAAARKELEQPNPKRPAQARVAQRNPLRDLEMRLTYRTVRVLIAVAEQPGSSNRAVGARAGILDQGQISKLLTRLHTLDLIENTGAGSTRGEPNAWTLTTRGWEIHGAIAQQTAST